MGPDRKPAGVKIEIRENLRLPLGESASDLNYKLANVCTIHFEVEGSKRRVDRQSQKQVSCLELRLGLSRLAVCPHAHEIYQLGHKIP